MRLLTPTLAAASLAALVGCAAREVPYHFRSPLVAAISARELLPPVPRPAVKVGGRVGEAIPGGATHKRALSQVTLSRGTLLDKGDSPVAHLRSFVGARDGDMTSVQLAIATLRGIGDDVDPDLAGTRTGSDLVALARARGAFDSKNRSTLGDLVVFDRTDAKAAHASLVGVVIRQDQRGVIEFLYLQRGVIRRGFADPRRPSVKRDDAGRVVNTHIRAGKRGDAKGTEYLAGQLFAGLIDRARLTSSPP